uniref:Si:dkeyp-38g8.5 n=1 Tax=Oryzias melastigma TaxID=30732 RepID=A0A3B3D5F4_ORYME
LLLHTHLFTWQTLSVETSSSAILKRMGLQRKMSHCQRYKVPNIFSGVTVHPESWSLFSLMDDAMQDRLQGTAPVLKALNGVLLRRKRRAPVAEISLAKDLIADGPEVEISLSRDEDGEEAVVMEGINGRNCEMERERALMQREKAVLERELAALERARALLDREKATLERERAIMERERAIMERERMMLEKDRDVVHSERVALEKERANLKTVERARTEEETGSSRAVNSEKTDRKKQLLYLFEKLIEGI